MKNVFVVIPNWNGRDFIGESIDSLIGQLKSKNIIVVDNGSKDGSVDFLESKYPDITLLKNKINLGFAGGVNLGIKKAIESNAEYIALLNNDAVVDKRWLSELVGTMTKHKEVGILTSKIRRKGTSLLDSAGDIYTSWLLPYPRGRDEIDVGQYDTDFEYVSSASGGASIYRTAMFNEVGVFDEDFFAYYEDVDLSLRAQHFGWRVAYNSRALVNHSVGATSEKIRGFTTFQSMKNLPLIYIKNVPLILIIRHFYKFSISYFIFFLKSIIRGQGFYAIKGICYCLLIAPKKLICRRKILRSSVLKSKNFDKIIAHQAPPKTLKSKMFSKLFGVIR